MEAVPATAKPATSLLGPPPRAGLEAKGPARGLPAEAAGEGLARGRGRIGGPGSGGGATRRSPASTGEGGQGWPLCFDNLAGASGSRARAAGALSNSQLYTSGRASYFSAITKTPVQAARSASERRAAPSPSGPKYLPTRSSRRPAATSPGCFSSNALARSRAAAKRASW